MLKTLNVPLTAVFSTLGRTAARAIETKVFADAMRGYYNDLVAEIKAGNTATFNGDKVGTDHLAGPCPGLWLTWKRRAAPWATGS